MFCGTFKIKMFCGSKGGSQVAPVCTGPACCMKYTCYSNMLPLAKCDSNRGPTKCVGGSLPMTKGHCQCKYGACSAQGKCPSQSGGFARLYDATPVEEDSGPLTYAPTGLLGSGLIVAFAALGLRLQRGGRAATQAAQDAEAALMAIPAAELSMRRSTAVSEG